MAQTATTFLSTTLPHGLTDKIPASDSAPQPDHLDKAIIGGALAVVFITLLCVVVLIFVYLYKHKGSYTTYETEQRGTGSEEEGVTETMQLKEEEESIQEAHKEHFV
ncbi:small cell adhesion glycoprotein [Protopterus annectens]|uniref:small cell adhesion glycoprotein n=1 Tax=Protopterus annectens TaxID=7888 RepID=UPI001CF9A9CB|nr:small cell adhesion glycoprotein [Protopterus annectens]XP_043939377.1 small cell adhesion glycoprotein [Protopterus annectens]XP_043939378.1 small cell adhesion glycoprotein [Protopterus annectens]XP_043939379.1 small cell adhesion glycoprotein [Protopterus annectens]XP_043939380.1 small cell adhesion glycoprotein [Protopterus annectens]